MMSFWSFIMTPAGVYFVKRILFAILCTSDSPEFFLEKDGVLVTATTSCGSKGAGTKWVGADFLTKILWFFTSGSNRLLTLLTDSDFPKNITPFAFKA